MRKAPRCRPTTQPASGKYTMPRRRLQATPALRRRPGSVTAEGSAPSAGAAGVPRGHSGQRAEGRRNGWRRRRSVQPPCSSTRRRPADQGGRRTPRGCVGPPRVTPGRLRVGLGRSLQAGRWPWITVASQVPVAQAVGARGFVSGSATGRELTSRRRRPVCTPLLTAIGAALVPSGSRRCTRRSAAVSRRSSRKHPDSTGGPDRGLPAIGSRQGRSHRDTRAAKGRRRSGRSLREGAERRALADAQKKVRLGSPSDPDPLRPWPAASGVIWSTS